VTLPPEQGPSNDPSAARWLWFSLGAAAIAIIGCASLWLCLLVVPLLALFLWSFFRSHAPVRET
jgi:hypothetical protein